MKNFYKFLNKSKNRFAILVTVFIAIVILSIVINFQLTSEQRMHFGNLQLWGLFIFTVTGLWLLKFWNVNKGIIWLRIIVMIFLVAFVCITISSPLFIYVSPAIYTTIGIILFSISWMIEMYLFWFIGK